MDENAEASTAAYKNGRTLVDFDSIHCVFSFSQFLNTTWIVSIHTSGEATNKLSGFQSAYRIDKSDRAAAD